MLPHSNVARVGNGGKSVLATPKNTAEETSDDDDDIVIPAKRRRIHRFSSQTEMADDSDDDLLITEARVAKQSSVAKSASKRTPRKLSKAVVTKKKALAKLKGRRAGQQIEPSSSDDEEDKNPLYDTDNSLTALSDFPDDPEGVEGDTEQQEKRRTPVKNDNTKDQDHGESSNESDGGESDGSKSDSSESDGGESDGAASDGDEFDGNGSNDGDIEGFVVPDDEIGVPLDALQDEIPVHLRRRATKKDRFRYVVHWLIQRRVNPAFDRNDPEYQTAWSSLDSDLLGLAQSKFSSSAWKPEFALEIKARPIHEIHQLPYEDERRGETCNACGRSNHPSSHYIRFSGKPYDKNTLEEIPRDADLSDDEGNYTDDSQGNELKPENYEWVLGSVCANNAEIFHKLRHWRWHLGDLVDSMLLEEGHLSGSYAERILWPAWKCERLVEDIFKTWSEKGGVIDSLHADFRKLRDIGQTVKTTERRVAY